MTALERENERRTKMKFDAEIHCPCDTCSHKAVCRAETDMQNLAYDIGNNISYGARLLVFLRCIEIKCDKYEQRPNLLGRREEGVKSI